MSEKMKSSAKDDEIEYLRATLADCEKGYYNAHARIDALEAEVAQAKTLLREAVEEDLYVGWWERASDFLGEK